MLRISDDSVQQKRYMCVRVKTQRETERDREREESNFILENKNFYDTLVMVQGGGVFKHLNTLACVPTHWKLSLILNLIYMRVFMPTHINLIYMEHIYVHKQYNI